MDQKICVKTIHFSFQIHVFSLQNHCFLRSRCIDGLQKLNKSCKKSSFFIEKKHHFFVKNQRIHNCRYIDGHQKTCKNHSIFIRNTYFSMKTQRFHRSRYIDGVQTSVIFIKKFDLPMAAARRPTSELVIIIILTWV